MRRSSSLLFQEMHRKEKKENLDWGKKFILGFDCLKSDSNQRKKHEELDCAGCLVDENRFG
jgi:hypothetical protein